MAAQVARDLPGAEAPRRPTAEASARMDASLPVRKCHPAAAPVEDGVTRQDLTARELEVLQMLARGLNNRAIAETLFVSDRTVDSHIKKLRRKIEAVDPRTTLIQSVYGVGYKFEPEL